MKSKTDNHGSGKTHCNRIKKKGESWIAVRNAIGWVQKKGGKKNEEERDV